MTTRQLQLNGEKHPMFFSNYVLAQIGEKYSLDLGALFALLASGKLRLMQLYDLAFFGMQLGYKKEGKEFPFKDSEELSEYLDKDPKWMEVLIECFTAFYPAPEEEETKKKPSKKKPVTAQ